MTDETGKATSAVETLRSMDVSQRYSMPWDISPEAYKALLDRVMDAPTDADGNVLHVGDEVTSWGFDGAKRVTSFRLFESGWWDVCVEGGEGWTYSDLHKVMPEPPESIEDVREEANGIDWGTLGDDNSSGAAESLIDRAYECGRRDGGDAS